MSVEKQARIVIVEDDPDVRDSLCAIIAALGHQCVAFESAESTLAYHELGQCDCLLVDFNLPGMSGTDFLQELQQAGDPPPACLYTGRVDPRIHDAAAGLKNTMVLEKGNDSMSIVTHLQRLLDKSE
ncbi:Response regulator protein TmoT [Stieleria maiorica]|uniref:Response regulator protein TmoT n=1 Tax=Stieleria maiorica TaxID=2795974 RepID=A0A5B9MH27_9BACT|nr:response regulator [Stieleria maiorica]QEF99426.1 Response regulator protein TmoT [Stieleria maiorica]